MIRRWLALTYYLYALRLAALSHFYFNRLLLIPMRHRLALYRKLIILAITGSLKAARLTKGVGDMGNAGGGGICFPHVLGFQAASQPAVADAVGNIAHGGDIHFAVVVLPNGMEILQTDVIAVLAGCGFQTVEQRGFAVGKAA